MGETAQEGQRPVLAGSAGADQADAGAPATSPAGAPAAQARAVPMRLQRFLARAGAASRRGSERLMREGRVTVNGKVVRELGSKVDPARDRVALDGRELFLADEAVFLMLNKPAGVLTTMSDPYGRPCVADLVPHDAYPGLFPVGRLDADTTGLLLLTTDGNAAQRLLHPRFEKEKHYLALIEGRLGEDERRALSEGVTLDDGPCAPARVDARPAAADVREAFGTPPAGASAVGIAIHEGRTHQVKRMFAAVGHRVLALHRDSFGPLVLTGTARGSWRMLTEAERADVLAATREMRLHG